MGWERRSGSGKRYYYRVTRTAEGQVVKLYCGRGENAAAAAAAVAHAQHQCEADREAIQAELLRLAGPDGLTAVLTEVARLLQEATLLAIGYHRPNYEKWRKRRGEKEGNRPTARPGVD